MRRVHNTPHAWSHLLPHSSIQTIAILQLAFPLPSHFLRILAHCPSSSLVLLCLTYIHIFRPLFLGCIYTQIQAYRDSSYTYGHFVFASGMEIRLILFELLFVLYINCGLCESTLYSAKLVHRFSDEAKAHHSARVSRNGAEIADRVGAADAWPKRRSLDYYRRLLSSDMQRQKLKLNPQFQFLYPSRGSVTLPLGDDFGWLLLSLSHECVCVNRRVWDLWFSIASMNIMLWDVIS